MSGVKLGGPFSEDDKPAWYERAFRIIERWSTTLLGGFTFSGDDMFLGDLTVTPRVHLEADTTFYVATTGSNTTGDGTQALPWLTLTYALDYISESVDGGGFDVSVQLGAGTYGEAYDMRPLTGIDTLFIQGNLSDSTDVTFTGFLGIYDNWHGKLYIRSMTVDCPYPWPFSCNSPGNSINFADIIWAGVDAGGRCVDASLNVFVTFSGSHTLANLGTILAFVVGGNHCHIHFEQDGISGACDFTLTGTNDFSGGFVYLFGNSNCATLINSVTGTATGKSAYVSDSSNLLVGSTIPGDGSYTQAFGGVVSDATTNARTWVPGLTGSVSNPTLTYTNRVGLYERVGKIVHAYGYITPATFSGGSGNLLIGPLPFASTNVTGYFALGKASTTGVNWGAGKTSLNASIAPNEQYIALISMENNAAIAAVQVGDVSAADDIIVDITYLADD